MAISLKVELIRTLYTVNTAEDGELEELEGEGLCLVLLFLVLFVLLKELELFSFRGTGFTLLLLVLPPEPEAPEVPGAPAAMNAFNLKQVFIKWLVIPHAKHLGFPACFGSAEDWSANLANKT